MPSHARGGKKQLNMSTGGAKVEPRYGCGSRIGTHNGTLVSGNMDQNLQSFGGLTHMVYFWRANPPLSHPYLAVWLGSETRIGLQRCPKHRSRFPQRSPEQSASLFSTVLAKNTCWKACVFYFYTGLCSDLLNATDLWVAFGNHCTNQEKNKTQGSGWLGTTKTHTHRGVAGLLELPF